MLGFGFGFAFAIAVAATAAGCCFGITNQVADYKWNPFLIEIYILCLDSPQLASPRTSEPH